MTDWVDILEIVVFIQARETAYLALDITDCVFEIVIDFALRFLHVLDIFHERYKVKPWVPPIEQSQHPFKEHA